MDGVVAACGHSLVVVVVGCDDDAYHRPAGEIKRHGVERLGTGPASTSCVEKRSRYVSMLAALLLLETLRFRYTIR